MSNSPVMLRHASGIKPRPQVEEVEEVEDMDTEEVVDSKSSIDKLEELLKEYPNPPDRITLDTWKSSYGEFYTSTITQDDIYVWRTLKRQEYKSMLSGLAGAQDNANALEEAIVRRCLLFPTPSLDFLSTCRAGIVPTLYEQIMFQSGFIPREIALRLVRKI